MALKPCNTVKTKIKAFFSRQFISLYEMSVWAHRRLVSQYATTLVSKTISSWNMNRQMFISPCCWKGGVPFIAVPRELSEQCLLNIAFLSLPVGPFAIATKKSAFCRCNQNVILLPLSPKSQPFAIVTKKSAFCHCNQKVSLLPLQPKSQPFTIVTKKSAFCHCNQKVSLLSL